MLLNQLKAGTLLNYVIIALNAIIGLTYTPYMLRQLGQSEYGIFSLAASIINYLSILDCGFGDAVIRYTAKFRAEEKYKEQYTMFGMFTVLYSIIGLVVIILGVALYLNIETIFGSTLSSIEIRRVKIIILLMVVNLALTFPLSIYGAIITAYENFIFLRVIQICRIVGSTIVMIALLSLGYKAIALVVVQTVFNIIALLLNLIFCKRKFKIKVCFERPQRAFVQELSLYSFWVFLGAIINQIYWSTGQFVLGAVSGTVAIAVFSVANQLKSMFMLFSTGISGVFLPKITSMISKGASDKEISNLFIKIGRIQYAIISCILVGFIIFGKQFIVFWVGEIYEDAYIITLIFFISLTIPLIQNLGITILQARNQMKFRSLLYLGIAISSLVLQVLLSRVWGSIGCAIAIGGALIIGNGLIMNVYYRRVQKIDIVKFWDEILKMSVTPVVFVLIALNLNVQISSIVQLIKAILVFTLLYIPIFFALSLNQYERSLLLKPIQKIRNDFIKK